MCAMRILVFQHAVSEHPGSFRDIMAREGHSMHAVELDEGGVIPPLDGFDMLLVMGGPMDVWETDKHPWLHEEIAAIRDWVTAGRPYLGLCFGHQLLAQAMGGHVGLMEGRPEVGIAQVPIAADPLFAGVPALCTCFQWHGAEVKRLPEGAVLLASSEACPIQAFRLGESAYGLQFHMELTHTTATEWAMIPEYAAALERVRGPGSLPEVQAEVAENFAALNQAADAIFSNFLRIAEATLAAA
jgi:GMP synthase-like glutamine amidotransferase